MFFYIRVYFLTQLPILITVIFFFFNILYKMLKRIEFFHFNILTVKYEYRLM